MPNKSDTPGTSKKTTRRKKVINAKEKKFAELMVYENMGCIEAARQAFGWACEPKSQEAATAQNLSQAQRIIKHKFKLAQKLDQEVTAQQVLANTSDLEYDTLRAFIYKRLETIRDDPEAPGSSRFKAISALEKMVDPSADVNLILMWVDLMWRSASAHCPCCHETFPMKEIENKKLNQFREDVEIDADDGAETLLERRMAIISRADNRKTPHPGQLTALAAPERNVAGLGAARCLEENERIVLSDGSFVAIKDVKNTMFEVPAFGVLGRQIMAKAYATDNGIKPVWELTTVGGRKVKRTGEHPFLWSYKLGSGHGTRTQVGHVEWKELSNIKEGELVAVPTKLDINPTTTNSLTDTQIKLLGYLLGDGSTTVGVAFTQLEGKVKEEFKSVVKELGCEYSERGDGLLLRVRGKRKKEKGFEPNHILKQVREWGINCKSIEKYFPDFVWRFSDSGLALLLNRLFACDGYAIAKGEIGITLASERMIRDIEMACLRLGINGRVRARTANYAGSNKKYGFKAWAFDITRKQDAIRFIDIVGIFGKEDKLKKVLDNSLSKKDGHHNWEISGLPEGYMWREVKSIEYQGELPTVSINVDTYNTFVTTFVEHNSGKSLLLAMFALLAFLIPGVEVWILARIYADAASEVEYLDKFLNTLFFPYTKHIITRRFDSKTDELTLESKWGSVLKVKSAKAKGSISGRELELALIAEPGWVPDDIYNHLRARMTSRLGRTILLGTPQGFGGILGRFVNMTGKDERGRTRRIPASERTIEAGCPWNISLLKYTMSPEQNPEYVSSELAAARQELTDSEFASEFEGLMSSAEGSMFPQLAERHLTEIPRGAHDKCVYVLGIDQGPKNFAACLLGFDGERVIAVNEHFDNGPRPVMSKMDDIRDMVPGWIRHAGGDPSNWRLTIFDADPPVLNELAVLEDEGRDWPTDYTFRTKDKKGRWNQENWRRETYEYVNVLAQPKPANLYFDDVKCDFLHDQLCRAQARQGDADMKQKGWIIHDAVRGDHVPDAFIMALWTILSGQLTLPDRKFEVDTGYTDAANAFEFKLRNDERKELSGFTGNKETEDETFESVFGRPRKGNSTRGNPTNWHYKDY